MLLQVYTHWQKQPSQCLNEQNTQDVVIKKTYTITNAENDKIAPLHQPNFQKHRY